MEKRTALFIVNPTSGTSGKQHILDDIERILDPDIVEWDIVFTEYKGHATVYTRQAVEDKKDVVVAVGGDGTVNEIARSLTHTDTALGIIPCGSGNGLARHLEIPMDHRKAIELVQTGVVKRMDYGIVNDVPFFCTCGVGFDAFVSMKFAEAGSRGLKTYLENTLIEGLRYKPKTYEIENEDGTIRQQAFLIACANASQYGNNAYIAPKASMQDGLIDVTILKPFTVLDAPQIAFQLFNKTITQNSHIITFQTRKLHIHRQEAGVLHFDGDPIMSGTEIDVEIVPGGLKVLAHREATFQPRQSILSIFSEYFNDLGALTNSGVSALKDRMDIKVPSKRLLVINRSLLRKLRNTNTRKK